jgi:hypothetical protein
VEAPAAQFMESVNGSVVLIIPGTGSIEVRVQRDKM